MLAPHATITTFFPWNLCFSFMYAARATPAAPSITCWIEDRGQHVPHVQRNSGYIYLVYTTPVNSAFRAIWLVPLSRDIKYYSPPGGFRRKKMAREPHFVVKYSSYLGTAIKLVLYILKQFFASVSVSSGGYLPRRSGSVNIHRYSPPLRWIIVKYCNIAGLLIASTCSRGKPKWTFCLTSRDPQTDFPACLPLRLITFSQIRDRKCIFYL